VRRVQLRVGTDIVPVARIARLVEQRGDDFLDKWFTSAEIAYCRAKAHPARHLAARFAAKEAVFKAVGGDSDGSVPWHEIEVVTATGGAPSIRLTGTIATSAADQRLDEVQVSLSHCEDYATATAVALVRPDE
jgi:holo-[acyl-carrier protein] synthase